MSAIALARADTRRRALVVGGVLVAALLAGAVVALLVGDYSVAPDRVLASLLGHGTRLENYVITQVRLPRLVMALVCGASLGIAGALLQSLLRNPLASPDLLGISGGASVAAVWGTLVLGLAGLAVAGLAFAGAVLVAAVLLLAARRISDGGYRIVLAGVGLAFLCAAVVGYLLKRARVADAQTAMQWITGSLGSTPWRDVAIVAAILVLCVPLVVVAARVLPLLALGDPLARGLGVEPRRVRVGIVVVAVILTAATTAFVGPIAFVALGSPAIARALMGRGSVAVAASAAVGALVLVAADLVAQFGIPGVAVPVGVVTGIVGAPYLLWLLATSKGRRA